MIIEIDPTKTPETGDSSRLRRFDPTREEFLQGNFTNRMGRVQTEFVEQASLPEADNVLYHRSFMSYLQRCWGGHHGAVIRPDILWFELLCEVASIVQDDPEEYRPLFTELKDGKGEIIIVAPGIVMPLDILVERLMELVPTDSTTFLPAFTTGGKASRFAMLAAFADIASPYYNYSMTMCGIPKVLLAGTSDDWLKVLAHWTKLQALFPKHREWMEQVGQVINDIYLTFVKPNPEFWEQMFLGKEPCGSGTDFEVRGWYAQTFFRKQPEGPPWPKKFAPHVAKVRYKHLDFAKNFVMSHGIFFSTLDEDNFLNPGFGSVLAEVREPVIAPERGPFANDSASFAFGGSA